MGAALPDGVLRPVQNANAAARSHNRVNYLPRFTTGGAQAWLLLLTLLLMLPCGLRGNQLRPWCYSGTALCRSSTGGASPRYQHAMATLGSNVFVHGGRKSPLQLLDGASFDVLDMSGRTGQQQNSEWANATSAGDQPPPRTGHCLLPWGRRLVAYGGTTLAADGVTQTALSDVALYDPASRTWRRLNTLTAGGE